jgi:hypothetical protein
MNRVSSRRGAKTRKKNVRGAAAVSLGLTFLTICTLLYVAFYAVLLAALVGAVVLLYHLGAFNL